MEDNSTYKVRYHAGGSGKGAAARRLDADG
jgi:hypothetical protein